MHYNLNDVAIKAGVSVVTASRVLNNVSTVKACNREKVLQAIKELDYIPNTAARSLAKGKTNVVGLLVPDLDDPFLKEIIQTVEKELYDAGYFLALSITADEAGNDLIEGGQYIFQSDRVDGVIVLTPLSEKEYVKLLTHRKIPFVIMDNQLYPFRYPSIVVDNFKGGYEAGKYFYEAGCERIAHIGGPTNNLAANERLKGFCKALEEVGSEAYIVEQGEFAIETGFEIMGKWIEEGTIPDAIFAGDDHIAFGIIDALKLKGLSVPEDVSVIGFDDHPFSSKLHPYLTTFKQPAREMGIQGVGLLLRIMNEGHKINTVIKLDPYIVERNSVKGRI